MSEPVTRVEFSLTYEDLLQFHEQYLRRFGTNRLRIPLMAMSLLLVPLAMMLDLLGGGQSFAATVMAFIVAVLIFLFFFRCLSHVHPRPGQKGLPRLGRLSQAGGDGLLSQRDGDQLSLYPAYH